MNFTIKELNELIYSLGISASKGLMCDKELNVSLLNKVYDELNRKIAEEEAEAEQDYLVVVEQDEQRYKDSHYVSNEEADEDAFTKVLKSKEQPKKNNGWITQAILDYVDESGSATYTEMNEFYRAITLGSNSFSHHLYNLTIPYKNRLTRRYLHKTSNGSYVVKIAGLHNWIEKEY